MYTGIRLLLLIRPFISSFYFFLSLQFSTLKFFVTLFSGTVRPRRLKLGTHVESWADVSCILESGCWSYSSLYFFIFLSLQFSTLEFFVTCFSGTVRPRRLTLGTHVGRCIMYTRIRLLLLIHPFISSFFFLSNFQHWNFSSHFSQELWGLEDWHLVHTWTVGRCIVCTVIRLLLLIRPIISSFFFLSSFQRLIFVTFFSGTVRPRRLKLGTHVDKGQMYHVYRNQALLLICPFISSFFFLSNYQTLKFSITFFSGTLRSRTLKLDTHVGSGQMYLVYRNQAAAAAYLSLYFFIFLSLQFSNIKNFRHTLLTNCET